jgi:hypothetical protein
MLSCEHGSEAVGSKTFGGNFTADTTSRFWRTQLMKLDMLC